MLLHAHLLEDLNTALNQEIPQPKTDKFQPDTIDEHKQDSVKMGTEIFLYNTVRFQNKIFHMVG